MKIFKYISIGLFGGIFVLLIISAIVADESAFGINPSSASSSAGPQGHAPSFNGETVSGQEISLASLYNEKPVILDFWATWCPNCRRDMPKLSKLASKYKDDITVLGVNLQEDNGSINEFNNKFGIGFDSIIDAGNIARSYGVAYTNTHVLIDSSGNIVDIISGDIAEANFTRLIASSTLKPTTP